jgi:phosphoadenosine phosphosulfate reductase
VTALTALDLAECERSLALDSGDPINAARRVVRWAVETFGSGLTVAASMGDTVLVDLAIEADPSVDVVFLDTGFHFADTLATVVAVGERYGRPVRVVKAADDAPNLLQVGADGCCAARKTAPLSDALSGRTAWMTGLRRDESPSRADTPYLSFDGRGLVKIAPLARWSDADVASFVAARSLIVNPLLSQGYPSIGCWPCTSKVADGEDPRSGRWAGSAKTECGIHL